MQQDAEGEIEEIDDDVGKVRDKIRQALTDRGSGSLLRGWRLELDTDFKQAVGLQELRGAMTRLGCEFGEDELTEFFDQASSTGVLTLEELDSDLARVVRRFQSFAATLGQPRRAFFGSNSLVESKGKSLMLEDFAAACRKLGLKCTDEAFAELFGLVDLNENGISAAELLFLEPDPAVREEEEQRLAILRKGLRYHKQLNMANFFQEEQSRKLSNRHRLAPKPWQAPDFEQLPKVICERQHSWLIAEKKRSQQALTDFIAYLRKTYGNEVRAWRRGMDPNGTYRLTLAGLRKFFHAEVSLRLDQRELWKALDKDNIGSIGLEDLTVQHAFVLTNFRQYLHEQLGSCAAVWTHPVALEAGRIPQRDGLWKSTRKLLLVPFTKVIRDLGWPLVNDAKARTMLLSSLDFFGCGFVSRSDLEWLDGWEPPEWMCSEPDPQAKEDLMKLVSERYPHPLSAWRRLFDRDDSNSVSWLEFQTACKKLRFKGNVGGAWRAFVGNHAGHISLQEYDIASAEILLHFKAWCMEHFGSVQLMFKCLDRDGSGSVSERDMKRACRRFHWTGDAHMLFDCLETDSRANRHEKREIKLKDLQFLDSWEACEEGSAEPVIDLPSMKVKGSSRAESGSPSRRSSNRDLSALLSPSKSSALPALSKNTKQTQSAPELSRPSNMLSKILDAYGA
eukprot:TRINITY_DN20178_c0_g1_i2.p1 TRINITY_DN20178_c0_g1~~TRINITY_DN20178_c0_g1_i2.p1  ORF type:complete len:677 (+),score=152.71 TRINITY_DN20178_c0_g1_i2:99-2129(+)